ncbi:MAG: DUF354 domain-containing protein [Chloroflexi bacterium]|nr:DUF354 domain-containing protein [Chloroflexota bacterium]
MNKRTNSSQPLRILLDIGHPAHVHLFRNAMRIWQERGHSLRITIRDKDITADLLDLYGFPYTVASRARKGTLGLALELFEHDWGVLKAALQHRSQVLIGTSVAVTHVARLVGAKSMVFGEDNAEVAKTFVRLAYPFAHAIVTPICLGEDYGKRHITYNGYQKLAYLHPNYFTPNPAVLQKLGVKPGEPYFILRFVSLLAAHDHGEAGLSLDARKRLVRYLSDHGRVFITSETPLPGELEPYRFHISPDHMLDAMAFAKMLVSDSQTMTAEAAILGVPAIRCNTFIGRISYLEELEHRYQLTYGFRPEQQEEMFAKIESLLCQPDLAEIWQERRKKLLAEKIDVTAWMVDVVEKFARGEKTD